MNFVAPRIPILIFHAKFHTTVRLKPAKVAAEQWCKNGANIHIQTHTSAVFHKLHSLPPMQTQWLSSKTVLMEKTINGGKCDFENGATPVSNVCAIFSSPVKCWILSIRRS